MLVHAGKNPTGLQENEVSELLLFNNLFLLKTCSFIFLFFILFFKSRCIVNYEDVHRQNNDA